MKAEPWWLRDTQSDSSSFLLWCHSKTRLKTLQHWCQVDYIRHAKSLIVVIVQMRNLPLLSHHQQERCAGMATSVVKWRCIRIPTHPSCESEPDTAFSSVTCSGTSRMCSYLARGKIFEKLVRKMWRGFKKIVKLGNRLTRHPCKGDKSEIEMFEAKRQNAGICGTCQKMFATWTSISIGRQVTQVSKYAFRLPGESILFFEG